MRNTISIILLSFFVGSLSAQTKLDDFGRIILNTYLSEKMDLPKESKDLLKNKLNQIASNNGMGGSDVNPRFIITANVNVGTKDIIAGPPQMIAQNIDITFFIGDAISNTIFSSETISVKGVGTNENKAFIEAIRNINPKSKELISFTEAGKTKIVDFYATQCDFIIKDAQTLVKQEKYDEAIYQLTLVPEICQECYFKCLDTLTSIYQHKIDADCKEKLEQAKIIWTADQTPEGAQKAGEVIGSINPMASCQTDVKALIDSIDSKLKADEKARWEFIMKQYEDKIAAQKELVRIAEEKSKRDDVFRENEAVRAEEKSKRDNVYRENEAVRAEEKSKRDDIYRDKEASRNFEMDKINASNARAIAIEYAKNQPKIITYNSIYWR
jgi:hypothetical protein